MRDRFGVSADWLLHGEGEQLVKGAVGFDTRLGPVKPPQPRPQAGDIELAGVDFSFIRRFDVLASAGPGRVVVSEDFVGQMWFSRDFLLKHQMAADLAGLIKANGDSMETLIPDGALMLVSFGVGQLQNDAIYIVRLGDDLLVKRVIVHRRDAVGQPLMISLVLENPSYSAVDTEGVDLRDFQPIARVISVINDV
ncbi:MAG: S24 family peptidase [Paracoccus sp. (in: a-proteobacteria)]|nr:S24 family peptidase [Paracoccus sp. (in: a-proteobacteria)]